jgi:hypothetical protein
LEDKLKQAQWVFMNYSSVLSSLILFCTIRVTWTK